MSGRPFLEGVAEATRLLEQAEVLAAELTELRAKVERLKEAQRELNDVDDRLRTLLETMDLEQQGHSGFGARMGWFLMTMRRLMREQKP